MSVHVLLNLLNELRKTDKMRGLHGVIALLDATSYYDKNEFRLIGILCIIPIFYKVYNFVL